MSNSPARKSGALIQFFMSSVFGFAHILQKEEDYLGTVYYCQDQDGAPMRFRTLQPVPMNAKLYWEFDCRTSETHYAYKQDDRWIDIDTIVLTKRG